MKTDAILLMLVKRIVNFIINSISYSALTFFVAEMFAVIMMVSIKSPLENAIVFLIRITPTIGVWNKYEFDITLNSLMSIFAFWTLIIAILFMILEKIFRLKLNLNTDKSVIAFSAIIHILAFIRLPNRMEFIFALPLFFLVSLISWVIFSGLRKLSARVYNYLSKSQTQI